MALRVLGRGSIQHALGIVFLSTAVMAVVACDPGHNFTTINQTDTVVDFFWNEQFSARLEPGAERLAGKLYINGDGGDPERHLFQAFDLEGNLICASDRTEQEWEDQNWTIFIVEAEECGAPP